MANDAAPTANNGQPGPRLTDDEIFTPPEPGMILHPDGYWMYRDPDMDAPEISAPSRDTYPREYIPYINKVWFEAWEKYRGSGKRLPIKAGAVRPTAAAHMANPGAAVVSAEPPPPYTPGVGDAPAQAEVPARDAGDQQVREPGNVRAPGNPEEPEWLRGQRRAVRGTYRMLMAKLAEARNNNDRWETALLENVLADMKHRVVDGIGFHVTAEEILSGSLYRAIVPDRSYRL